MSSRELTVEMPEAMGFLFEPARYKVAYGGRGGGKSHSIAKALLVMGMSKPIRVLCAREFQKSIADSVHKLLSDQINGLGLGAYYEIQNNIIRGKNGTEFTFHGLKHNIANIKSVEGTDIAWCEEAHTISKSSWETLIPTIRKDGSEIWVSFNPELEDDETYKRFVIRPPTGAKVVKVNWSDNPYFPEVLRQEMQDLRDRDQDAYLNVWEGHCRQQLEGAVYGDEMRQAMAQGRIRAVPYDASKPVHTFWDLGWSDLTCIIMAQNIGGELRIVDYIQNRHKKTSFYLQELQKRPYVWGKDFLPHDAKAETLGAEMSIEARLKDAGRDVQMVPRLSVADGIDAARTVFNRVYMDQDKCADLIHALRHYRYDVDPNTGRYSKTPLHDDNSNGADAFRYFAVMSTELNVSKPKLNLSYQTAYPQGSQR